jgi:hypothetical protein
MMLAAFLDSTETTPALDISRAEQLSQPVAGWKFSHRESALTVRNLSFAVRSCSPRRATCAAQR